MLKDSGPSVLAGSRLKPALTGQGIVRVIGQLHFEMVFD
jgi:hypothetical protein